MKIQFDFPKRKHSEYARLLNDYVERVREFAKVGEVKGKALEICFVYGLRPLRAHGDDAGGEDVGCGVMELSSEALSRHIANALNGGISDIRITVRSVSVLSREDIAGGIADHLRDARIVRIALLHAEVGEELAEVLAAEQVYRAFMIYHNRKYHK